MTIATDLEEQPQNNNEKEASKLRRKYTTVNENIIDINKLFGITTILFLQKMNNKSKKAIIKSSTAKENAAAASNIDESKAGSQSPQDIINQSGRPNASGAGSSNNNENSTNNTSNESGRRDSGALLSYNNKSKTFVLPQFVSYRALEIILSMLSIHEKLFNIYVVNSRYLRQKETERQWTDSEVTTQLMIGSLEQEKWLDSMDSIRKEGKQHFNKDENNMKNRENAHKFDLNKNGYFKAMAP